MGIKKYTIRLLKILGISYINIIGLTMIITGAIEEMIWLLLLGISIVDLSPSFIKTIFKDAWGQNTY